MPLRSARGVWEFEKAASLGLRQHLLKTTLLNHEVYETQVVIDRTLRHCERHC